MEKESITVKETEEEVARLKRLARKMHDVKLRQRYDIIRLFLCKRAKRDIAVILDISLTQVYLIKADPQKQAEFLEQLEDTKKAFEWRNQSLAV